MVETVACFASPTELEGAVTLGDQFPTTLAAAQAGAEWALSAIYLDLHPAVLRYLKAQQPNEADDIASDAWIDVAAGLHRFQGDERDLRKWVFTIARRRLLDHRRRTLRRRTNAVPMEDLVEIPDAGDVETTAVDALTAQEAMVRLVELLPADQAEVVLLRVVGDLTADEAAHVMNKRPGAIRVLQHRALERLARDLAPEAVTHPPTQAI